MSKKSLLIVLGLYLLSSVFSYGVFSFVGGDQGGSIGSISQKNTNTDTEVEESPLAKLLNIDPSAPKDQVCPLNGAYYTLAEKNSWLEKRPLAVMIENAPDARPQSGLSKADIVFETIAEGGVTRFMPIFYCAAQAYDVTVAPVRSARTYFIDWASGFNRPLYAHVGGANLPGPADALGQLGDYGWNMNNDLNQFSIGYPTFVRDYNRIPGKEIATEHTMVSSTDLLWQVGAKRDWTYTDPDGEAWDEDFIGWSFDDTTTAANDATTVAYDFWSGYSDYSVKWELNPQTGNYMRSQGGEAHIDLNDNTRIEAANVIVLLTTEKGPIDEKKHMLYGTTGSGDALLFKNGQALEVTWTKKTRTSELNFVDAKGKDVPLKRGLTWISVVSDDTEVDY